MTDITLDLSFEDGQTQRFSAELPLLIGRDSSCGLVLKTWRVARHHARIFMRQDDLWVDDLGSIFGTTINGRRIASYGPWLANDELVIGPCLIKLHGNQALAAPESEPNPKPPAAPDPAPAARAGALIEAVAAQHDLAPPQQDFAPLLLDQAWRQQLHAGLLAALQLRRRDIGAMSEAALRAEATEVLHKLLAEDQNLPIVQDHQQLVRELVAEAVGLGPLEPLLADAGVSEIMVNRHDEIFIEKNGRLQRAQARFSGEQAVLGIIERIVSPLGRRIDDSSPMVDARLGDGSRVNAVIGPVALRGASLTIRKFPQQRLAMADLLEVGALDAAMAEFLALCVRARKNLLVSGGTGSGKTSLLNILSNAIPAGERIITIEDAAELRLNHGHLVSLEARPANLEGRGRIEIRDLVRNALRMRPDRIVVGECRGAEAFDMLAAMNTGHEGSLTTLHANSPRDALARLETMILMAGMDLPLAAVREHIAASIDIIVQLQRVSDGRRLVSAIVQLTGLEAGRFQLQELFLTRPGPPAVFAGCGLLPEGFAATPGLDISLFSRATTCQGKTSLAAYSGAES